MSKTLLIVILLLVALITFYLYRTQQLPTGIEGKGTETAKATIALATSILSFLSAGVTLILKILEIKSKSKKSKKS